MIYSIYITEKFEREMNKLPEYDKEIIRKIFLQLKNNPYVGDQIRYKFFREKRVNKKRIYYLIYENLSAVLFVAFWGKKAQQETIDEIIKDFPKLRQYIENQLNKNN